MLPASGAGIIATDFRYALAAQRDCPDLELIIDRFIEAKLAAEISSRGFGTVAFEAHEMTVERHTDLVTRAQGVRTIPFGHAIEELREVKGADELELLATACRISCQAIADVLAYIRPGMTERGLAALLGRRMIDLGADGLAFDTIVASGPERCDPAPFAHRPAAAPR